MFLFCFRTYMPVVSRIKANKDKVISLRCSENLSSNKVWFEKEDFIILFFHVWRICPATLFRWWFTIQLFSNTSTSLGWTDTDIIPPPASSACCWPSTFVTRWDQQNLWDRGEAWLSNQKSSFFLKWVPVTWLRPCSPSAPGQRVWLRRRPVWELAPLLGGEPSGRSVPTHGDPRWGLRIQRHPAAGGQAKDQNV